MTVRPSVPHAMVFFFSFIFLNFFGCFKIISFILKSNIERRGIDMRKKDINMACIIIIFMLSFLLCVMIFKLFIIPAIHNANETVTCNFIAYCMDKLKGISFDFKSLLS